MTRPEVQSIVLKHLRDLVPGAADRELDLDAPLTELGADSLDLVDVASRSMAELNVKIARSEIGRIKTLNDLVSVLEATWAAAQAPTPPVDLP